MVLIMIIKKNIVLIVRKNIGRIGTHEREKTDLLHMEHDDNMALVQKRLLLKDDDHEYDDIDMIPYMA